MEADSDSAEVNYKGEASKGARSQNEAMEEAISESRAQVKYMNDERGERSTSAGINATASVGGVNVGF